MSRKELLVYVGLIGWVFGGIGFAALGLSPTEVVRLLGGDRHFLVGRIADLSKALRINNALLDDARNENQQLRVVVNNCLAEFPNTPLRGPQPEEGIVLERYGEIREWPQTKRGRR